MKDAAPKVHLLDISEPLLAFHELKMRCGVVIKNAEAVYMLTESFLRDKAIKDSLPRATCHACLFLEPCGEAKRQYVYGLMEAQRKFEAA